MKDTLCTKNRRTKYESSLGFKHHHFSSETSIEAIVKKCLYALLVVLVRSNNNFPFSFNHAHSYSCDSHALLSLKACRNLLCTRAKDLEKSFN